MGSNTTMADEFSIKAKSSARPACNQMGWFLIKIFGIILTSCVARCSTWFLGCLCPYNQQYTYHHGIIFITGAFVVCVPAAWHALSRTYDDATGPHRKVPLSHFCEMLYAMLYAMPYAKPDVCDVLHLRGNTVFEVETWVEERVFVAGFHFVQVFNGACLYSG